LPLKLTGEGGRERIDHFHGGHIRGKNFKEERKGGKRMFGNTARESVRLRNNANPFKRFYKGEARHHEKFS